MATPPATSRVAAKSCWAVFPQAAAPIPSASRGRASAIPVAMRWRTLYRCLLHFAACISDTIDPNAALRSE